MIAKGKFMIKILEKNIADKIAAGEVVDRPLSVVKELVENAIDADASAITVEIKHGGKTYIRVTDDGVGISADEAELAFERHATSKIKQASDLEGIETLGFRGEALASIAAVSRTEIITKTRKQKSGIRLAIEGSQTAEKHGTGCPDGTTIIIRDLFFNTPARLKFMKTDATEGSKIIEFVSQIALAYTQIKLRLISNGTMLFSTQGKDDLYQNILTVYSKEVGMNLIPVAKNTEGLSLKGYISSPGISKPNRKSQIFFVNGRVVNSKIIEKGIKEAYSDKLFDGRHPIAFLFLQAEPKTLDVNIHPNKREVRFDDEALIVNFVREALRSALLTKESIPEVKTENVFKQKTNGVCQNSAEKTEKPVSEGLPQGEQENIKSLLSTIRKNEDTKPHVIHETPLEYQAAAPAMAVSETEKMKTPAPFDFDELTIIDAIFGTYILARDETCFYMIDQHAAHERIFFEQLMGQYKREEKQRQIIMVPIVLNVSYAVKEDQYSWLDALQNLGFLIEPFGPKTYRVTEIPMFMALDESEQFLKDFIDNMSEQSNLELFPVIEKLIMKSCKSAVKAHDYLSEEEISRLLSDLRQCENPFSCPHGRPTFIKMTQYEIEKMFKRV